MAEIRSVQCTDIYLYHPDEFLTNSLVSQKFLIEIQEKYSLTLSVPPIAVQTNQSPIVFTGGVFRYKEKEYSIENLQIENRKVSITGHCETSILKAFYTEFLLVVDKYDSRPTLSQHKSLVHTHETVAICKFNKPFSAFLSTGLVSDIPEALHTKINNHGGTVIVEPYSVKYKIKYRDVPDEIVDNKIQLVDKLLTFEVREKTSITDCIIFTVSPCDFGTHMQLIETVEKML